MIRFIYNASAGCGPPATAEEIATLAECKRTSDMDLIDEQNNSMRGVLCAREDRTPAVLHTDVVKYSDLIDM